MSFFGGLVGAIKGAVVGFVTGGPAGAVVGAVGGAVSGSSGHSASQGGLDYVQPTFKPRAEDMYLYQPGYGSPAAAGVATHPIRHTVRGSNLCKCKPVARTRKRQARMAAGPRQQRALSAYGGRRYIQPFRGGPGGI